MSNLSGIILSESVNITKDCPITVFKSDVIVIWKLDRLGRSLRNLVDLINTLNEKGIGLQSLNDPIDTTTAQDRLIFNIFGSLAEFERELIRERTLAGLEAAKEKGNVGGRPKGLSKKSTKHCPHC